MEIDKQDMEAINSPGICDWCGDFTNKGFYIAAMNRIYCPFCFEQWHKKATYFEEDSRIELKNFTFYERMFKTGNADYHLNI